MKGALGLERTLNDVAFIASLDRLLRGREAQIGTYGSKRCVKGGCGPFPSRISVYGFPCIAGVRSVTEQLSQRLADQSQIELRST